MNRRALSFSLAFGAVALSGCVLFQEPLPEPVAATQDDGEWMFLEHRDLPYYSQNTDHRAVLGQYVDGYNEYVLMGIDRVQARAMDGGGYFTGVHADPPEAPVGYELSLFGHGLLKPARPTSYCSGATYAALIEALNLIYPHGDLYLSADRMEAMRMQEVDGSRREDGVKGWGHWNDDGWGCHYMLVQYTGMGEEVPPERARPGDFMNISWVNGRGHSVVFLGWYLDEDNNLGISYWSSAESTNGFADVAFAPVSSIESVRVVRLTRPDRLFQFDPMAPVETKLAGDKIYEFGIRPAG